MATKQYDDFLPQGRRTMLNAISITLRGGDEAGVARASKSLERQGFVPAAFRHEWATGVLCSWSRTSLGDGDSSSIVTPLGRACCVGPLWYGGRFGSAALELVVETVAAAGRLDEDALRGNFALFVSTDDRYLLLNDSLGFVRVYISADRRFYSTSWLATCAYSGSVDVDTAAAIEYVLLGASHSEATVARGVTILPRACLIDLVRGQQRERPGLDIWSDVDPPASFDAAVEVTLARLRLINEEIASAFPMRVRAALSGGFDSRLILAGLLASDNAPELFVYGGAKNTDVSIARQVATSVGLPLETIDKQALEQPKPLPDLERLIQNALFFDGLPNDGVYDRGADQQTRLAQTADGYLVLNGGGGEIFRNYFHLADRRFRSKDVVKAFYRGFDAGVFRAAGGLDAYSERLAASMERSLGTGAIASGQKMTRKQVELLYPLFRCHYWMAVNNSVAVRHGHYATPLIDTGFVRLAAGLPLAWKNSGKLEGRMIAALSPEVARQPSSYGFRFSDGPGWSARLSDWATYRRPILIRPFINGVHRKLRRAGARPGTILRCRSMLPGEWRLDPVLDLDRLPDDAAFSRALAVEVVWRELMR
jgi:asparagine synthase (glutamine-hydrolysing)